MRDNFWSMFIKDLKLFIDTDMDEIFLIHIQIFKPGTEVAENVFKSDF